MEEKFSLLTITAKQCIVSTMKDFTIGGFEFYTDGSRLICHNNLRAREFMHGMEEESIIELSKFIVESMSWMNTNYTDLQTSAAKEAYQSLSVPDPAEEGRKVIKRVQVRGYGEIPIYETFPEDGKLHERIISDELLQAVCIVFHACSPYLWENNVDSATDGFYTGEVHYDAYISRNYKELVSQLIGGYISSFPQLDIYTLKNLSYAFLDSDEPIEYISQLGDYISHLPPCSSDYIPFAFRDKSINLSLKRFLHWCENYGVERSINVMCSLVEISDNPDVPTIKANGDMERIKLRCDRVLENIEVFAPRIENERIEHEIEAMRKKTFEDSSGVIYDFHRDPDDTYHKYAIYALRSSVDLAGLGDTLGICVGGESYQNGVENGTMNLYTIQDDERQYVLHVEHGNIIQLRGYHNHSPQDEDVINAAHYCLEKENVSV